MNGNMFIPETLHVGFVKRQDTFTGKLGYVVYINAKKKLAKERSWNSWRDHEIEPLVLDNKPRTGYTFNRGVQRYGQFHIDRRRQGTHGALSR